MCDTQQHVTASASNIYTCIRYVTMQEKQALKYIVFISPLYLWGSGCSSSLLKVKKVVLVPQL